MTRHLAGQSEEIPGIELSSLINAAREGNHMQFELADAEECLTVSQLLALVGRLIP